MIIEGTQFIVIISREEGILIVASIMGIFNIQYSIGCESRKSKVGPMLLRSGNPFNCHEEVFKKNLNASKPSQHPSSGGKVSKGLAGNIGSRDKISSWYQTGSPM